MIVIPLRGQSGAFVICQKKMERSKEAPITQGSREAPWPACIAAPSIARRSASRVRCFSLHHRKNVTTLPWAPKLRRRRQRVNGFTLLELLIVVGIIGLLLVLIAPAFTTIKSGTDSTSAAYTIKGALDTARTYAKANNTYTWVGFFEEDASQASTNPATPGPGRIVVSIVASKDGSQVYTSVSSPAADMDSTGTRLLQVGKLIKLDNMHLRTFANGLGTGETFPTRPAIPGGSPNNAKIGDTSPPDSLRYFHYPPTVAEDQRQYRFVKMIQFSPRGECRPQNDSLDMNAVIEVGLQQTHGTSVPALADPKNCAVQLTGFSGNVKIYQM
jgi:prepilin-type N-terminal cleavage/methylation domain-containing protein